MAQQPSGTKLKIRLKGVSKNAAAQGAAANNSVGKSVHLQALRSAVDAICRQGVNSLPGAVLLAPWREEEFEQQWQGAAAVNDGQQQLSPIRRRVRRPRAAADLAVLGAHMHLPQWGRHRQRRSVLCIRRRSPTHLLGFIRALAGDRLPLSVAVAGAAQAQRAAAAAAAMQVGDPQPVQAQQPPPSPQLPSSPAKEQQPSPAKEQQLPSPAKEQQLLSPAKEQQALPVSGRGEVPAPVQDSAQPPRAAQAVAQPPPQPEEQQQQPQQLPPLPVMEAQSAPDVTMAEAQPAPADAPAVAGDAVSSRLRTRKSATGGAAQQEDRKQQQQQQQQAPKAGARKQKQQAAAEQEGAPPAKQRRLNNSKAAPTGAVPAAAGTSTTSSAGKAAAGRARAAGSGPRTAQPAGKAPFADGAGTRKPTGAPAAPKPAAAAAGTAAAADRQQPAPQAKAAAAAAGPAAAANDEAGAGAGKAAPHPPAAAKPDSPPSETSHQQPIGAAVPQLVQRLQAPQLPQEQTALSRDRSQCSLTQQPQHSQQAPASVAGAGAPGLGGSTGAGAAGAAGSGAGVPATSQGVGGVGGGAAASAAAAAAGGFGVPSASCAPRPGCKDHLLELAPSAMTPAAQALGSMRPLPAVTFRRVIPCDRPIRTQEQAAELLDALVASARDKKHQGDRRMKASGSWDVMALNYYALSALEFLMLNDAGHKLLAQLQERRLPVAKLADKLSGMAKNSTLYRQVGQLCNAALQCSSNCRGPDVAKQALRMLLERMAAICQLKHVHSQREALSAHARLLKGGASISSSRAGQQPPAAAVQQQQQQGGQRAAAAAPGRPPARPAAAAVATSGGSANSPQGQQQQAFNKRSPDDSNTSNQDRVALPGLVGPQEHVSPGRPAGGGPGGGGASGHASAAHHARALMLAESQCAEHLGDLLKITDGMHQTVMRMQQFLESPEVLGSDDARAAALHISVLGLDAGMYSVPRIVAHAEAALTSILKYMRSAS